jgi:HEAT repeat protein/YHS domain-containing protein
MSACPVCNKPVDPVRARFVAVRAGKVVAYCSAECRESQDTKPTKVELVAPAPQPPPKPKTPPQGLPVAKPKTPPTGVPAKPKTPPTGVKSVSPPLGVPKSVADLDSMPVIEILHEPASGVVTSAKDERTTQPTGKIPKEDLLEIKETAKRPDGSKGSGGADSASVAGEVIEPKKRARTRPSGKHLTKERTDSTEAKAGWDWLDDEPADQQYTRPGTITESEKPVRWPFVVFFILAALGGGGYYAYTKFYKKPAAVPETPVGSGTATEAPSIDAMAAVTPDALVMTKEVALQQAKELLRKYIQDGSPRVQRLAAGALGRTGDPAAVAALQQAVKQEKVVAARLKLAYALARSGDKSGREMLVTGLSLPQRSDKLDAATRLAWLGDDRAKPLLSSLLNLDQHRLRAAEELSRLKDPAATKLLEQVRSDTKSSIDEKATATIALFRTGRAELAPDVKKLLENKSWDTFAAYALAEMKDDAAKAFLVKQLKNTIGEKVRTAYALKKLLGDGTDDVIAPVAEGLASEKDQEQIYAAEAILILAGEPQWSEYQ